MMIKKISKILLTSLLSVLLLNNTFADDVTYTNDYGDKCRGALLDQVLNSVNTLDLKMKGKIDKIIPALDRKYNDEKLFILNNKIISILSKTQKNTKSYNLYAYLLLQIDTAIDNSLYSEKYNKAECSLLLKPLGTENQVGVNGLLSETKQIKENKETLEEHKKQELSNNTGVDKETIAEMIAETKNTYKETVRTTEEKEMLQESIMYYKEFDYVNTVSEEAYKTDLSQALEEVSPPHGMKRDIRYDLGLTIAEKKELEELETLFIKKMQELLFEKTNAKRDFLRAKTQIEDIEKDLKVLAYRKIMLIKMKWERKNICITEFNFTLIKDKDTFHSISSRNAEEAYDLKNDFIFARYYGYNLSCRFIQMYPELRITTHELSNKSVSEIKSLYENAYKFIPSPNNYDYSKYPSYGRIQDSTTTIYGRQITTYEQAQEDYSVALQMKELIFKPMIKKLEGVTDETELFLDIPFYQNEFYKKR